MTIDLGRTLRDAAALFGRDRDLLLRLAGPLFFLPVFALQLLVDAPPPMPASGAEEAATLAWLRAMGGWTRVNGGWYLLAHLLLYWGHASLFALYLDPARPDVGGALRRGARLMPRYAPAMLLVSIPVGLGLLMLILPGLYLMGRLLLTGPAIVAEQPSGPLRSVRRSLALTRGNGLALMGLAALSVLARWLLASPLLILDTTLRGAGAVNPVAVALVDAGAALAIAATELGLALAAIEVYRRLASNGT